MVGFMQTATPKDKTVSVLKLEHSPSHSWWWDSHNSPKHSKWLLSNLQDLDDKVKEMLRLIEEDADSFAQRAEMYYQKRPELINLVEEFYRAYRSLAERYDHLRGEIRQNVPRALQVQYGISCDSPSRTDASGGRHNYSPLRQGNQMFENLLKKACQIDDPPKELDQVGDLKQVLQVKPVNVDDKMQQHDCSHAFVESSPNSSDKEESVLSSSDSEVDNSTPYEQLQQELKELEDKNKSLAESQKQALELKFVLENKVRDLEEGHRIKEEKVNDLQCKILELNEELAYLSGVLVSKPDGLSVNEPVADKKLQATEPHRLTISALQDESFKSCNSKGGRDSCPSQVESMHGQKTALFTSLQDELNCLKEENRMQKIVILERGEEKREVIRQLSVSLDMLKSENQRLELALCLSRKRLHVCNAAGANGVFHSPLTAWKHLFSLVGFKDHQPFVAVAL